MYIIMTILLLLVPAAHAEDRTAVFNQECQAHVLKVTWELYPDKVSKQADTRTMAERECKTLVPHINEPSKLKYSPVYLGCFYGIQIVIADKPMSERQALTSNLMKEHCKL